MRIKSCPLPQAVLFDLDGTLVDTAPDLANTLNHLRREQGLPPLPYDTIRPQVSHGTAALLDLGFPDDHQRERLRQPFLDHYRDNIAVETRLFPGIDELLQVLEQRLIPWGVVTNKPAELTDPLMTALALTERAACIISGDTIAYRKPHPGPLLHACEQIAVAASDCLYIGDAERDIRAGRAAGMTTLAALFGYLAEEDDPVSWHADAMISSAHDILPWLGLEA